LLFFLIFSTFSYFTFTLQTAFFCSIHFLLLFECKYDYILFYNRIFILQSYFSYVNLNIHSTIHLSFYFLHMMKSKCNFVINIFPTSNAKQLSLAKSFLTWLSNQSLYQHLNFSPPELNYNIRKLQISPENVMLFLLAASFYNEMLHTKGVSYASSKT